MIRHTVAVVLAGLALVGTLAAPAQALVSDSGVDASPPTGSTDTTPVLATGRSTKVRDADCTAAVEARFGSSVNPAKYCTLTISSSVGPETVPTKADIAAMTADESSLTTTAAAARRCKTWKQWYTAASYHEQHVGRFCYDHVDAYAKPWGGYHRCGDWWGIGYTASNIRCFAVKVTDKKAQGGYFRQQWDWVHWSFLVHGLPLSFTRKMHANIFPSGNVVFHNN